MQVRWMTGYDQRQACMSTICESFPSHILFALSNLPLSGKKARPSLLCLCPPCTAFDLTVVDLLHQTGLSSPQHAACAEVGMYPMHSGDSHAPLPSVLSSHACLSCLPRQATACSVVMHRVQVPDSRSHTMPSIRRVLTVLCVSAQG